MSRRYILSAGSNAKGQLAIDSLDDAHNFTRTSFQGSDFGIVPAHSTDIRQIACGSNFTLLLLDCTGSTGTYTELWASGDGARGQLGPDHHKDQPSVTFRPVDLHLADHGLETYSIRTVEAGWETSYAVLTCPAKDDVLISFGANDFGDLGIGTTKSHASVSGQVHRVDFKPAISRIHDDSTLTIEFLATGTHHVLAQCTSSGTSATTVVGWGTCRHGQLGPVDRPVSVQPSPITVSMVGSEAFTAASAGSQHSVLLQPSGHVKGIGSNRKTQIAKLDSLANVVSIGCTWNGTYAVLDQSATWTIFATGDSSKGQLGREITTSQPMDLPRSVDFPFSSDTHQFEKMACGSEHVLCLFTVSSGDAGPSRRRTEVWGWGWNEHGNMGTGHTNDLRLPTRIWPVSDEHTTAYATEIWAGCGTSWILIEDVDSS